MEYVLDNTIGSVLNVLILTNINILCSLKKKVLVLGGKVFMDKEALCLQITWGGGGWGDIKTEGAYINDNTSGAKC